MNSLLIINGIIDEYIQAPYYPEFAVNNTYGIVAYNQSIYDYTQIALYAPVFGCMIAMEYCYYVNQSTLVGQAVCAQAANECRDNVESPYYAFGDRGVYDIRHPYNDTTPPNYMIDFLNSPATQEALGVDTNYTSFSNTNIYYAFQQTGDFVYPNFLEDLEQILNNGVRVSLVYGDADYIWYVPYTSPFPSSSTNLYLQQLVRRRSRLPTSELHPHRTIQRGRLHADGR